MSSEAEEEAEKNVCANCGIAGVDDIKLEDCDDCDLVKYCSDKCKEEHREQHTEECKKRAANKRLFTQPDGTDRGECPICFLPMPLQQNTFMECCGQWICNGCCYAHLMSEEHDFVKASRCPFCRTSGSDEEEYDKRAKERLEANDPAVLCFKGTKCYDEGDYDKALKYWTKAAEFGDIEAHHRLGYEYDEGKIFEKDKEKAVYHYEKASIGGHPKARYNLALYEAENDNMERAVRHIIIAANLGHGDSMKALLPFYKSGFITKEKYGATLRAHQAAINATKSSQRDLAEELHRI